MPLPINSMAEERSAAVGKVMVAALTEPTWTKRIGVASCPAFAPAIRIRSALAP